MAINKFNTHPASSLDLSLFAAVKAGDLLAVDKALGQGASLVGLDEDGVTALHLAAARETPEVLMRLAVEVRDQRMLMHRLGKAGEGCLGGCDVGPRQNEGLRGRVGGVRARGSSHA